MIGMTDVEEEPVPRAVEITRKGRVLVAIPLDDREDVLTTSMVRETLRRIRRDDRRPPDDDESC